MMKKKRIGANKANFYALQRKKRNEKIKRNIGTLFRYALVMVIISAVMVPAFRGGRYLWEKIKTSNMLEIKRVVLVGNKNVKKDSVLNVISADTSISIIGLNMDSIKSVIMKNPWVEDVKMSVNYKKILKVKIKERIPVVWVSMDSSLYLIDNKGALLSPVLGSKYSLPVITGVHRDSVDTVNISNNKLFKKSMNVLETIKQIDSNLYSMISEVFVKENKILVFTISGIKIVLPNSDIKKRVYRLVKIMNRMTFSDKYVKEINLEYERVAYVK